jgi:hypothetical protein
MWWATMSCSSRAIRALLQQRAAGLLLLLPPPALDQLVLQPPPRPDQVAVGDHQGGEQDGEVGLVEGVPAGPGDGVAEDDGGVGDQPDPDQQVQVQPHGHGVGHVRGDEDQGGRPRWARRPPHRRHDQPGRHGHHDLQPPGPQRRVGGQAERQRDQRGHHRDEDPPQVALVEEQLGAQQERRQGGQPQGGRAVATQPAEASAAVRQGRRLRPDDPRGHLLLVLPVDPLQNLVHLVTGAYLARVARVGRAGRPLPWLLTGAGSALPLALPGAGPATVVLHATAAVLALTVATIRAWTPSGAQVGS